MLCGIFAGITWALETVILGIALSMAPFVSGAEAALLAPFVSTFLHDFFSAVYLLLINAVKGNLKNIFAVIKSRDFLFLALSSAIGGPIGMTGYVLAVRYMGASIGAVASAVYPAIGSILACIFLKEKMRRYRWLFLVLTLLGVFALSYSPQIDVKNFRLGLLGVLMCSLGWGTEGVILSKCFRGGIKSEYALQIRQLVSAVIYGAAIIPALGGVPFTLSLLRGAGSAVLPVIAAAALFATVSYLLYYKAIARLGVAKAMGLNITYTAWAIVFSALILRNFAILNLRTVILSAWIVICAFLAAADFDGIFTKKPM